MDYFYALIWFFVGLFLIARMGRENPMFYLIGGFFLYLSIWWAADAATGTNLFVGIPGMIFRVVTVAVLAGSCVMMAFRLRKYRRKYRGKQNGK